MPNVFKYTTSTAPSNTLKKDFFYVGNDAGDYGNSFYTGVTPPSNGYTIYLNKATGGPSIYTVSSDAQLIALTNQIANTNYTTAAQCLTYFAGQTDKIIVNREYEGIVMNGLVLNLDAGYLPSYPQNGTTWTDLSANGNNGTLTNGPTFNSGNGGGIVYDGVDDVLLCNGVNDSFFNGLYPDGISILTWIKLPSNFSIPNGDGRSLIYRGTNSATGNWWHFSINSQSGNPVLRWWIGNFNSYSPWVHYSPTTLNTNTFYHCVLTWKPISSTQATTKIYLNNTETYTNTATKDVGLSQSSAERLGNFPTDGWSPQMTQYNLLIYNRALTSSEVSQNYNAQKGRFGL